LPNILGSTTDPLVCQKKAGELSRAALKTCIYQEEKKRRKGEIDVLHVHVFFFAFFLVFTLLQLTALGQ
jgi:hypothetical protein